MSYEAVVARHMQEQHEASLSMPTTPTKNRVQFNKDKKYGNKTIFEYIDRFTAAFRIGEIAKRIWIYRTHIYFLKNNLTIVAWSNSWLASALAASGACDANGRNVMPLFFSVASHLNASSMPNNIEFVCLLFSLLIFPLFFCTWRKIQITLLNRID